MHFATTANAGGGGGGDGNGNSNGEGDGNGKANGSSQVEAVVATAFGGAAQNRAMCEVCADFQNLLELCK